MTLKFLKRKPKQEEVIAKVVDKVIYEKFSHFLKDIDWRIQHFTELKDKVPAEQLNLQHHLLTGYTVTNNSPVGGSIAWAGLHIVHMGVDYTITDGNAATRYIWWDKSVSTTVLQNSNTKPTLIAEDVLVFINEGGIAYPVPGSTQAHGSSILGASVNTGELANLSVTSAILGASSVIAGKIATGGVSASGQFAAGVVDTAAIGSSAVTAIKVGAGQITEPKLNTLFHFIY